MSDDSTQLSVAELLARNGQGTPSSSGGGGRRRRSGRGITVNDLTGDMPLVREGGSAHAAPDVEEPAAPQAPDPLPQAYDPPPAPSAGYSSGLDYSPRPVPDYSPPPSVPDYSPPSGPDYSPLSGPISFYDPLAPGPGSPASDPTAFGAPPFGERAPGHSDPFASPNGAQPTRGGRRARREAAESLEETPGDLYGPPPGGGRRRRPDADQESTEVQPFRGHDPSQFGDPSPSSWAPPQALRGPDPQAPPRRAPEPPEPPQTTAWNGRRGGADAPPSSGLPAWSARRRPGPGPGPGPGFPPPDDGMEAGRNGTEVLRPGPGGRNGGRNGSDPGPSKAWSLASQDQQLLSGPTLAGDLLRDEAEREGRRAGRRSPSDPASSQGAPRPVTELLAVDAHGRTEIYPAFDPGQDVEDFDLEDPDFEDPDFQDLDYDDDLDDYDDEDYEDDDERPSRSRRAASLGARSKALLGGGDRPQWLSGGAKARGGRAPSRDARRGGESSQRQWLVLAGQVVGAAVIGMLLFKGFEKMWDVLPFVALALAVVVILGLVALVRVLRRTDDMYSTVIAVVVGVFVTLGPLAFLLSTN